MRRAASSARRRNLARTVGPRLHAECALSALRTCGCRNGTPRPAFRDTPIRYTSPTIVNDTQPTAPNPTQTPSTTCARTTRAQRQTPTSRKSPHSSPRPYDNDAARQKIQQFNGQAIPSAHPVSRPAAHVRPALPTSPSDTPCSSAHLCAPGPKLQNTIRPNSNL